MTARVFVCSALQGGLSEHKHYTAFLPIMKCCKSFGMNIRNYEGH